MIHQSPCFEQDFHAFGVPVSSGLDESGKDAICARLESSA